MQSMECEEMYRKRYQKWHRSCFSLAINDSQQLINKILDYFLLRISTCQIKLQVIR